MQMVLSETFREIAFVKKNVYSQLLANKWSSSLAQTEEYTAGCWSS